MNDRDRILAKIKKCLRLAQSSNQYEAAAALRHAQKMMQEHGITDGDVLAADATESRTPSGAGRTPPGWESMLASTVADAFGCRHIHVQGWKGWKASADWSFVGCDSAPELAAYTFAVMFRQVKKARAEHIAKALKRCGPTTRTRRADLFCNGWVQTVAGLIQRFAADGKTTLAIEAFFERRYPSTATFTPVNRNSGRQLKERELGDFVAGRLQGGVANLRRPMDGPKTEALEHH